MTTAQVKAVGLIIPLLIIACSSDSDHTKTEAKQQLSERVDLSHLQRPVLLAADQIQGFSAAKQMDDQTETFHEFAVSAHAQNSDVAQLHQQLKLNPNQVLLFGNWVQRQQQGTLIDSLKGQVLQQAWQLSLNHLRFLKTPPIVIKDAYESTADWQTRLNEQQQKYQQLSQKMQLDLGRLENAANFLGEPMRLNQFPDPWSRMTYDPDQHALSTRLSYPAQLPPDRDEQHEPIIASVINFQVKMPAEQAKKIIELVEETSDNRHYLAYILDFNDGNFRLEKVAIIQVNYKFDDVKAVTVLNPQAVYLQQVDGTGNVLSEQAVLAHQALPFRFKTSISPNSQSDDVGLRNQEAEK